MTIKPEHYLVLRAGYHSLLMIFRKTAFIFQTFSHYHTQHVSIKIYDSALTAIKCYFQSSKVAYVSSIGGRATDSHLRSSTSVGTDMWGRERFHVGAFTHIR